MTVDDMDRLDGNELKSNTSASETSSAVTKEGSFASKEVNQLSSQRADSASPVQ